MDHRQAPGRYLPQLSCRARALLAAVGPGVHADVDAAVAAAIRAEGAPEFSDAALKQRCGELFSGLPALPALERSGVWEPGRAGHLSSIPVGPRSSG